MFVRLCKQVVVCQTVQAGRSVCQTVQTDLYLSDCANRSGFFFFFFFRLCKQVVVCQTVRTGRCLSDCASNKTKANKSLLFVIIQSINMKTFV